MALGSKITDFVNCIVSHFLDFYTTSVLFCPSDDLTGQSQASDTTQLLWIYVHCCREDA